MDDPVGAQDLAKLGIGLSKFNILRNYNQRLVDPPREERTRTPIPRSVVDLVKRVQVRGDSFIKILFDCFVREDPIADLKITLLNQAIAASLERPDDVIHHPENLGIELILLSQPLDKVRITIDESS